MVRKLLRKSFLCSFIRKYYNFIFCYNIKVIHSSMRLKIYLKTIKEKPLNQRVDIKSMNTRLPISSFWQMTHYIRKILCFCDFSFFRYSFHSSYRKVRHDNPELSSVIIKNSSHHHIIDKQIFALGKVSYVGYIAVLNTLFYIINK